MAISRSDINSLRKEKEAALLTLGKYMHKYTRDGGVTNEMCVYLSERITQIDADVCAAEGGNIPWKGICPSCSTALASSEAKFCADCGTNIDEYYLRYMEACLKCSQLTMSEGNYCTVCGVKREIIRCAKCSAALKSGAGFCVSCGTKNDVQEVTENGK
jgi:rRNA maturation endonuclease Nob1